MPSPLTVGAFLKQRRHAVDPAARRLGRHERLPARVGRPVTQEEVAEAADVSRTWYALLEADGARASPALAVRLADVFGLESADRLALLGLVVPDLGSILSAAPTALLSVATPAAIERTARNLARIREHYLNTGAAPGARPRIVTSWARSRAAAVSAERTAAPLAAARDAQLAELREAKGRLSRAAHPVLAHLVEQLSDVGYVVVLTDAQGRILFLRGDRAVVRLLERLEFVPGGDWSEAAAGTNAIGTALVDGRPLQMMAAEHFCAGWQHLTCTAAPIRDPHTHAIVGALDITGGYRLIRDHLLALIMRAALDVEERLALLPSGA